jgi:hypothetical protein
MTTIPIPEWPCQLQWQQDLQHHRDTLNMPLMTTAMTKVDVAKNEHAWKSCMQ